MPDLSTIDILLTTLFGLGVGFLGGYAGIGGAPLLIFLFTTFLGYTQHMAQGTVVAVMLGPMTLPGLLAMRGHIRPLLGYAVIGIVTYAIFSYLGAYSAYFFSSMVLSRIFAGLLILLGLRGTLAALGGSAHSLQKKPLLNLNCGTLSVLGALLGFVGGFFGIGAGVLLVPLLIWLFHMDKDDARTLSLLILLPPVSIGAVIRYQSRSDILWPVTVISFAAYFISNYWGARLGKRHAHRGFQLVLGILLAVMGIISVVLSI